MGNGPSKPEMANKPKPSSHQDTFVFYSSGCECNPTGKRVAMACGCMPRFQEAPMLQLSSRYDDDRTARANLQDPAIIMLELETMYISCESVDAAASLEDFVGVCVFTKDGSKVYTDANGRRVRSGYLWMVPSRDLRGSGTFHSQAYEKGFSNMDGRDGVAVVGFSQQNGRLQVSLPLINITMFQASVDTKCWCTRRN